MEFPMRHMEVSPRSAKVMCGLPKMLDDRSNEGDGVLYADRDMFMVYVNQCPDCLRIYTEG